MNLNRFPEDEINRLLEEFIIYYNNFKPADPGLSKKQLAKMIDHTILKPEASLKEIENLCNEALSYNFASVCVNSSYVDKCFNILKSSEIKVCSVIGFPLGAAATEVKVKETEYAVGKGASEVDMVINIGELKSRDYEFLYNDIKAVADAAHRYGSICKVIIETCLLTDQEKLIACLSSKQAGADFVKTSTGFSKGGAEVKDVALMKFITAGKLKVKASGGIRSAEDALKMISYGADRLGTSSGIKILDSYLTNG